MPKARIVLAVLAIINMYGKTNEVESYQNALQSEDVQGALNDLEANILNLTTADELQYLCGAAAKHRLWAHSSWRVAGVRAAY